jgi:hypothetical protein
MLVVIPVLVEPRQRRFFPGAAPFTPFVRRTPGISCEAVPASDLAGAGMRRHVHPRNHAAESFVSFIPLFDGMLLNGRTRCRPLRTDSLAVVAGT